MSAERLSGKVRRLREHVEKLSGKLAKLRSGTLLAALILALLPRIAAGQGGDLGTIAGVVKDSTGGVLPGVTVEVSSPSLIEKVRTVTTDGQGEYKVISLRPGVYEVTFSLSGFGTVKRAGIELTTAFTATINAEMKPGALEETVTITGASPLVDIQNTVQQRAVTAAVIEALPAGRQFQGFAVLTPGVSRTGGQDVGGASGDNFSTLAVHGSHAADMPLIFDGMRYNNMNGSGGGGLHNFQINSGAVQELAIQTAGASVENQVSGVFVNVIPKDGSNNVKGDFYVTGGNKHFQSNNLTDSIKTAGLTNVTTIDKIWDVNPGVGGPIVKDRLWFHTSLRYWGNIQNVGGMWYNATINTPFYNADLSRPATGGDTWLFDANLRLNLQATPKNKFTVYYDNSQRLIARRNTSPTLAPEATERYSTPRNGLYQVSWSSPRTNRLLLEVGGTIYPSTFTNCTQSSGGPACQPEVAPTAIGVQDQGTGISYGAISGRPLFRDRSSNTNLRLNVAYVTGSHALKFGVQMIYGYHERPSSVLNDLTYVFLNGVPRSFNEWATPYNTIDKLRPSPSFYAQDQWTLKRFTATYGLRIDTLYGYVPAITLPPTRFVPTVRDFAEVDGVPHWEDLSPRIGGAFDVFGNGRTAIKASLNRYVASQTLALANAANPVVTSVLSANRLWTPSDNNYAFPNCDFSNLDINNDCGAISNRFFGQANPKATILDPNILSGFQKRPYDWEVEGGVTQELGGRVAASATFFRHWFGNQYVTQNTVLTPADYDGFCVAAPSDSRLPNGGANQICGLYDAKPGRFGQGVNEVTFAKNLGDQKEVYTGVDLNLNVRFRGGAFLQGGSSIGRLLTDNCWANNLPQVSGSSLSTTPVFSIGGGGISGGTAGTLPRTSAFCHVAPPLSAATDVKFAGTYNLPWKITAAATYQNVPGIAIAASYAVPTSAVTAALSRTPTSAATVAVIPPSSVFRDRINQVDFRTTRSFQVGKTRLRAHVDIYNLFNSSGIQGVNVTYGMKWLTPTSIVQGRLLKLAAQLDF